MKHLIYKNNKGAIEADDHYRQTGHYIKESRKKILRGVNNIVFVKHYDCSQCDFTSQAGEIYEEN